MKHFLSVFFLLFFFDFSGSAQGFKDLVKNAGKKDSSGKMNVGSIFGQSKNALSNAEMINGLKEALQVGAERSSSKLSMADGFFKDAALKILMPPEALKVEKTLRSMGMNQQVDQAILAMNRAAEDAAKTAAPIFINAIKGINFEDALGILKGGDFAASNYLKSKTTTSLTEAFRPVIESSLQKVSATKYWNTLFTNYNMFSAKKVNTDLAAYVTEKALAGIFLQLSREEQSIRKDPLARTSDILRKVFN